MASVSPRLAFERPIYELEARLREPLPCASPEGKRRLAAHLIMRLFPAKVVAAVPPRDSRAALFGAAARSQLDTPEIIASVRAADQRPA